MRAWHEGQSLWSEINLNRVKDGFDWFVENLKDRVWFDKSYEFFK